MKYALAAVLVVAATAISAQTVHKCVGPDGTVTFTKAGCGTELKPEQLYDATNVAPSGGDDVVPWGNVPQVQSEVDRDTRVRGVGPGARCRGAGTRGSGDYPARGMSVEQVRSMYGQPDSVSASNSGYLRQVWHSTEYRPYISVTYDQAGCVDDVFVSQSYNKEPERRQPGTRAKTVRH